MGSSSSRLEGEEIIKVSKIKEDPKIVENIYKEGPITKIIAFLLLIMHLQSYWNLFHLQTYIIYHIE